MNKFEYVISDSEIKRVTRKYHGKEYKFPWRGLNIIVKRLLSLEELSSIYDDIMTECSYGNDIIGALLDFSFRKNFISYYSNVTLPDDIEEVNYIVYETDLFDMVYEHINKHQANALMKSIGL